jgi:hypothetical protein
VPALATQGPVTVTVAPAGVPALAVQVAVVAAVGPVLVHTTLPVNVAPGLAVAGKPVIDTVISADVLLMVTLTLAVSHATGVAAGLLQIW